MINSDVIERWVHECMKTENIENYTVTITGSTDKGDGYGSDITFVHVIGKNNSQKYEEQIEIDLAFKSSKGETSSNQLYGEAYEREKLIYKEIFPEFRKFQTEKNVENYFDAAPKCYKVFDFENVSVLGLENLRKRGFELHPKTKPMNVEHIKKVLYNYAKLHAVSLAMRDQDKTRFLELTRDMKKHLMGWLVSSEQWNSMIMKLSKKTLTMVEEIDPETHKTLEKILEPGLDNVILKIVETEIEEEVISHGDCWNNNFMFKYEVGRSFLPK